MSMDQKQHLVDRICSSLGVSLAGLARELNITRSAIGDWKKRGIDIPIEHCKYLEGRLKQSSVPITCADMRPNDWHKYWPELAKQETESPQ